MTRKKRSSARQLSVHALLQSIRTSNKQAVGKLSAEGQRTAVAAAKRARIHTSGLVTRIRSHMSARGRRSQFHRDARG